MKTNISKKGKSNEYVYDILWKSVLALPDEISTETTTGY